MNKSKYLSIFLTFVLIMIGSSANALNLSYEYLGVTYGTMDVSAFDADTLQIEYTANSTLPGDAEVTGFGFTFIPSTTTPNNVWDPLDGTFANDQDDLDWIELTNLNAIPNPANSSLTKTDFLFGVTEGNANNINPPGILESEYDTFYLDFSGVGDLTLLSDLSTFVAYTGIRLQSLPDSINGGSLFLTDTPNSVPEPTTMLLLGTGLIGVAGLRRRFKK